MKFGTPFCKAHGFGPACDKIFVLQIAKFVVLTGPAAGEILELHLARLMVLGLPVTKFSYCRLPSLWS